MTQLAKSEQGLPPVVHRDKDRAKRIIEAISEGQTTKMAAQVGGIARRTLYEWIYKGQEIRELREEDPNANLTPYDEDYLWFLYEYELAEHSRKRSLLTRIEKAGEDPKKWQANAWLLERLHPDEFSLRRSVEITDRADKQVFTFNIGGPPKRAPKEVQEADYEIVEE